MANTIIGILLLLSFFLFIAYVIRGGNLMVGFFVMAVLWCVIGLVPFNEAVNDVFAKPALNYGPTIIYIAFGSWFGRVLVDTGIAGSISMQAQRVGKKRPVLASILVCLITALIFVSAYGVGSVIAIGVILLPILHSLGVPKNIAVSAFTLSIGASMYVNVVLFNQIKAFFPAVTFTGRYLQFGWIAMGVQIVAVIIFLLINSRKIHAGATEVVPLDDEGHKTKILEIQHGWQYLTYFIPVLPVLLNMVFHWDAVPALLLSTLIAMLLTGYFTHMKKAIAFMNDTIQTAVSDIAGLIFFLMALVMFSAAAQKNTVRFEPIFKAILPHSTLVLAVAIGILAPLALFRGPLHVWGAGAATASVLSATHLFSPWFMLPLLYIPSILAVSADVTQSWNVWALSYTKLDGKKFITTAVPVAWVVAIINEVIAWSFFGH
ncbi:gluconate:proton symporter [Levilactobacillus bambusae]|uniref:Gluconate:proton symporter n=1 Tax=Levilactobacillus bambusae TaxID=2024736 RepID=A0A2V1N0B3_9LACO|nr:gluconate:proton symporter [Levilactobacillus bambusae]PWG00178.1 gluconate:proton symporter [Levilactobacillus bambusae]